MKAHSNSLYKPALLVAAGLALFACSLCQRQINRLRADPNLGLLRVSALDNEKAPPTLAFVTVALGSFRGLIANALWMRATDLQDEGKHFEMVQLADWITKLEPTFVQVWLVQAWNMAYNISVKFSDPADRWQWVQRGIELLRDEGIRYNPKETLIYRELAWFFQHKMGQNLDDAHLYYKTQWAREMTAVFGGPQPNYAELLNPTSDDAQRRVWLLRERYKMDPQLMREADQLYGPLEWRLPEAHAIYWAHVGMKNCDKDLINLRRSIYQASQMSVYRGRVVRLPADRLMETGPDFDKVKLVNDNYEKMVAEETEKKDAIQRAHRNFLREVIYLLTLQGRNADANYWLSYLRGKYADGVPPGISVQEYAFSRLIGELASLSYDKTKAAVEGLLVQAYRGLALDDDERANGLLGMARQLAAYYTSKTAGQEKRLPPIDFELTRRTVVEAIVSPESRLAPELKARLRTRLNLPAPTAPATNAPAVKT